MGRNKSVRKLYLKDKLKLYSHLPFGSVSNDQDGQLNMSDINQRTIFFGLKNCSLFCQIEQKKCHKLPLLVLKIVYLAGYRLKKGIITKLLYIKKKFQQLGQSPQPLFPHLIPKLHCDFIITFIGIKDLSYVNYTWCFLKSSVTNCWHGNDLNLKQQP